MIRLFQRDRGPCSPTKDTFSACFYLMGYALKIGDNRSIETQSAQVKHACDREKEIRRVAEIVAKQRGDAMMAKAIVEAREIEIKNVVWEHNQELGHRTKLTTMAPTKNV